MNAKAQTKKVKAPAKEAEKEPVKASAKEKVEAKAQESAKESAKATTKFIRVPPRKARLAADLVRGMLVEDALAQLQFCNMKGGFYVKKTIQSAIANAEMQFDVKRDLLKVLEVRVDEGPRLKRAKSKCRGGRVPVLKRMSHFTVVVGQ